MDEALLLRDIDVSVEDLVGRLDTAVQNALRDMDHQFGIIAEAAGSHGEVPSWNDGQSEARGAVFASARVMLGIVEGLRSELDATRVVVQQQQELLTAYQQHALTDPLTGLINRRGLEDELNRRLATFKRHREPLSVLFVDIDHFKKTNDEFGHEAGDKVLRSVTNVMRGALRDSDSLARFGGEEFVAILPRTRLLDACRAAERIRVAVANSLIAHGQAEIPVSVSVGVADCALGENELLQRADGALYAAKNGGRNCVFVELDGENHPLRPHEASQSGHEGRQFLRFRVEGIRVKLRQSQQTWHELEVVDESLIGIGLRANAGLQLSVGETVEIEYCDEIATAIVIHHDRQRASIGLRWAHDLH